jgi:hypothetical protein
VVLLLKPDLAAVFSSLVEYAYTGNFKAQHYTAPGLDHATRAWILADQIIADSFKNCAMEKIYNSATCLTGSGKQPLSPVLFRYILENTAEKSKLLLLYEHLIIRNWGKHEYIQLHGEYKDELDSLLEEHPGVSKRLFLGLYQDEKLRSSTVKEIAFYKESIDSA